MVLRLHGSNEDYWRDDNPFIMAWHRFGDDLPVNNFVGDTPEDHFSGCLVDSSNKRAHLAHRLTFSSIGLPVSGIAPWSVSGLQLGGFAGSSWIDEGHNGILHYHHTIGNPSDQSEDPHIMDDGTNTTGRGRFAFGTETQTSGMMIAGWCQIPAGASTPTAFRPLWGDGEINNALGTRPRWLIHYVPQDDSGDPDVIRLVVRTNGTFSNGTGTNGNSPFFNGSNRTVTVDNANTPWPVPLDEPFFWCFTMHQALHPDTQNPDPFTGSFAGLGGNQSGLLTLYLGTTNSGLFKVASAPFEGTEVRAPSADANLNRFAIGNRENLTRGANNARGMPAGTVLDEMVFVQDGYMSFDRIEHYMNSGIQAFPENNPERPEFVPVLPGTDKLQAYFSFDLADSPEDAAQNSAPETSGIFQAIYGTNCRPVEGIRGGSGMRMLNTPSLLRSSSLTQSNHFQFFNVPIGSGRNHLFPDLNRGGKQTWIGWIRPGERSTDLYMPIIGWRAGSDQSTAWGKQDWTNGTRTTAGVALNNGTFNLSDGGAEFAISGFGFSSSSESTKTSVGGNNMGYWPGRWQLWALCIDFENGVMYHVKDAKHVHYETNKLLPSGWSDESLLSNAVFNPADRTTMGAGWMFSRTATIAETDQNIWVDDWAVYDRILTLPEMSGYALSGIIAPSLVSPLNTSLKRTLGYWKFDGEQLYDPEGVSGIRYDDSSWYRHHLNNTSGQFSISTNSMNTNIGNASLQVETSGSMLHILQVDHGSNLDLSSPQIASSSGFMCGTWLYLPSGDLSTEGNGSSGLYGDHHVMGAWGQAFNDQSWQLGIRDNQPYISVTPSGGLPSILVANGEVPFDEEFFLFAQVFPSGNFTSAEIFIGTNSDDTSFYAVGESPTFIGTPLSNLEATSTSGFSVLNAPHLEQGFPQQTRMQGAFVYAGSFNDNVGSAIRSNIGQLKRVGVTDQALTSGAVSTSDPSNVSHWRFDTFAAKVPDVGREQNFLRLINTDGHTIGLTSAYHGSGVIIRQNEYLDTLPNNGQTRRLDLGSGTKSWTVLSWVVPPVDASVNTLNTIVSKDADESGVQIFTPQASQNLNASASGRTTSAQNGQLAPGELNHIAVVYDRDNNEFTTIVNGRYAGSAFDPLVEIPVSASGFAIGGRGDVELNALFGGPGFSGIIDDMIVFDRALTLPEISGLAANSYNYVQSQGSENGLFGGWLSGIPQFLVSGLIGSFMHGQAQDLELIGGYISGVSGFCQPYGGYIHGKALVSGLAGHFMHGSDISSGVFGHFLHGLDSVSGFFGSYTFGSCVGLDEFDCTLNFSIVSSRDLDARLGVEKTQFSDFDARLGVVQVTQPPGCTLELPVVGTIGSGTPFELTVRGSGFAVDNKTVEHVRFTFADFKNAEIGSQVGGTTTSGAFEATRTFDTPGWYTVKIEVLDSFGYRSTCCRPFLLVPSGTTSGIYLNSLPGLQLTANIKSGSTIQRVLFEHSVSGLDTTSGILEYTDFADQQESLVNSLEMPSGTIFASGFREHDYTMPGKYCAVWSMSGSWGIVSDSISDGIDFLG